MELGVVPTIVTYNFFFKEKTSHLLARLSVCACPRVSQLSRPITLVLEIELGIRLGSAYLNLLNRLLAPEPLLCPGGLAHHGCPANICWWEAK